MRCSCKLLLFSSRACHTFLRTHAMKCGTGRIQFSSVCADSRLKCTILHAQQTACICLCSITWRDSLHNTVATSISGQGRHLLEEGAGYVFHRLLPSRHCQMLQVLEPWLSVHQPLACTTLACCILRCSNPDLVSRKRVFNTCALSPAARI